MPERRYFAPIDFKTRFSALDGVRALAVLLVFGDHYGGGTHGGRILNFINEARNRGWVGVDLFFVLSGFLITGILYDTRGDSQYFKRFFARRSLRIFPVFYIVVLVLLLLTPILKYQWHWEHLSFLVYMGNFFANYDVSLYDVVSSAGRSANASIVHLWSLCVEEQFYLLWPVAVWFIGDRVRLLRVATGISLLALALRIATIWYFSASVSQIWIMRTLPYRVDSLLMGAILALVLRGPAADRWQRSARWVFLFAFVGVQLIFRFSPAIDSPWILSIGLTLTALASVGLIGMTLRPGSLAFRFFSWKPLRVLGKYSYGFYIYHLLFRRGWMYFQDLCVKRFHSVALATSFTLTCVLVVTFLVAKFSYDFFESRFLRYKVHFEYDSEVTEHKHVFSAK